MPHVVNAIAPPAFVQWQLLRKKHVAGPPAGHVVASLATHPTLKTEKYELLVSRQDLRFTGIANPAPARTSSPRQTWALAAMCRLRATTAR